MIIETNTPDYDKIYKIWYNSVKATHSFLSQKDFNYIDSLLKDIFPQVKEYICYYKEDELVGFLGFNNPDIEMLFLNPNFIGQGIGFEIISYLQNKHTYLKVDVNKQNENAYKSYIRYGFKVIGESEQDSLGLNYPIVHLEWKK